MKRTITFQGNPLSLAGNAPQAGDRAPAFTVTSQDMKDVTLADFNGKIKLISTFPSLDTPVCDLQVKEFNKRAAGLSPDIAVIGISKDLPFAQKRFCSQNNIKNETVLSDYKASSFGLSYGLLIEGLQLLARAVLIIDKDDIVRHVQVVPELTVPPDYDGALKALESVIKG
jgi:thiol peroxidase